MILIKTALHILLRKKRQGALFNQYLFDNKDIKIFAKSRSRVLGGDCNIYYIRKQNLLRSLHVTFETAFFKKFKVLMMMIGVIKSDRGRPPRGFGGGRT
jgi:hypothetical protein